MKMKIILGVAIIVIVVTLVVALSTDGREQSTQTPNSTTAGAQQDGQSKGVNPGGDTKQDPASVNIEELLSKVKERKNRQYAEPAADGKDDKEIPGSEIKTRLQSHDQVERLNALYEAAKRPTTPNAKILEEMLFGGDTALQKETIAVLSDFANPYYLNLLLRIQEKTADPEIKNLAKESAQKVSAKIAFDSVQKR